MHLAARLRSRAARRTGRPRSTVRALSGVGKVSGLGTKTAMAVFGQAGIWRQARNLGTATIALIPEMRGFGSRSTLIFIFGIIDGLEAVQVCNGGRPCFGRRADSDQEWDRSRLQWTRCNRRRVCITSQGRGRAWRPLKGWPGIRLYSRSRRSRVKPCRDSWSWAVPRWSGEALMNKLLMPSSKRDACTSSSLVLD